MWGSLQMKQDFEIVGMTSRCSSVMVCFFFSSRRRHTRLQGDWSSDVCSSDLAKRVALSVHDDGRDEVVYAGVLDAEKGEAFVFRSTDRGSSWTRMDDAAILKIGRASCRERV